MNRYTPRDLRAAIQAVICALLAAALLIASMITGTIAQGVGGMLLIVVALMTSREIGRRDASLTEPPTNDI